MFFQECSVAMGHKYGVPVVSFIPVAPWASPSIRAGNSSVFSYIKDFVVDVGKTLDSWARVANTYLGFYTTFIEPITYIPNMEKIIENHFQYLGHENRPALTKMFKNISLSLIDSDVMSTVLCTKFH